MTQVLGVALLLLLGPSVNQDPGVALDQEISAAETSLREGELQTAESRYRSTLLAGWMLMGGLEAREGHLREALGAFERASVSSVEASGSLRALALVHLQMGDATGAVAILTHLRGRDRTDSATRRLTAQALEAAGQLGEAVQELEEAAATAPGDLEVKFALGGAYLQSRKVDPGQRAFAEVVKGRPIPQTHVLVGRAYLEARQYDLARAELEAGLGQDPRLRHAHYYLGMAAAMEGGDARFNEAIGEFRQELKLDPGNVAANLRLGMALVETRKPAEALTFLEDSARSEPTQVAAFRELGHCLLALDRPTEAATALRRALDLARDRVNDPQLTGIHYELAVALRKLGSKEAEAHFAQAGGSSAHTREREVWDLPRADRPIFEDPSVSQLAPLQRQELKRKARTTLTHAYMNLGVIQAQEQHFDRAAEFFEDASALDPDFPQVQYSLGISRFNAQQFDKASGPLTRALAAQPKDAGLKRMLALSFLNTEEYGKAADLLRDDPERASNVSLQYAYGLALVRSDRSAEAQSVFAKLLAENGDSAELQVLLGQASAQQGDYEKAVESLKRALQQKADVAEANATLGVIYLKQGRLEEAEQALRAELKAHPSDPRARQNLAAVLDLAGRGGEAVPMLRVLLQSKPGLTAARCLLGKILLAQGSPSEAAEQLELAARLAPDEAQTHYQLAQAYQRLGRKEDAERQFEVFRELKDKRRGESK